MLARWAREPTPLDADREATDLILVAKGSAGALVFEHADALRAGREAPLTVTNFPGWAIVPTMAHAIENTGWGDKFSFIGVGVGLAKLAAVGKISREGFVTRTHDSRVLHIWWREPNPAVFPWQWHNRFSGTAYSGSGPSAMTHSMDDSWYGNWYGFDPKRNAPKNFGDAKYVEGDKVVLLRGDSGKSHTSRAFQVDDDGTMSVKAAPHLVLGVRLPKVSLVDGAENERFKLTLDFADELRQGLEVPLTLASHPGYAIVGLPRREDLHRSILSGSSPDSFSQPWGVGPASYAIKARLEHQLILSTDGPSSGYVADASSQYMGFLSANTKKKQKKHNIDDDRPNLEAVKPGSHCISGAIVSWGDPEVWAQHDRTNSNKYAPLEMPSHLTFLAPLCSSPPPSLPLMRVHCRACTVMRVPSCVHCGYYCRYYCDLPNSSHSPSGTAGRGITCPASCTTRRTICSLGASGLCRRMAPLRSFARCGRRTSRRNRREAASCRVLSP